MGKVTYCNYCRENQNIFNKSGYNNDYAGEPTVCPICKNPLTYVDFPSEDFTVIKKISNDVDFIESMINLRKTNLIEYQMNMSKMKNMQATQAIQADQMDNTPKCPTCHSKNIHKIQLSQKAGSVFMWGLLSQKVKKIWHCDNCGYEW